MDWRLVHSRAFSTCGTAALAAAVLGSVLLGGWGAPRAWAADTGSIGVVIDGLSPVIVVQDGTLRITGRLVNRSSAAADNVSVRLRVSNAPIPDRATLAGISAQQTSLAPVFTGPLIGTATHSVAQQISPGAQAAFTIEVPVRALAMTRPGAYAIAVEAIAGRPNRPEPELAGVQRTFLTWFPPGAAPQSRVIWLWPLADWPARTTQGIFLNEQTPNAIRPGGRLDRIVRVGSRYPGVVSWVADPEVLQAAAQMAQGYQVLQEGFPTVGDQGPEAQTWLDIVRRAIVRSGPHQAAGGLLTSPYADIDARASRRAGLGADVVAAVTEGSIVAAKELDVPIIGAVSWAPRGRIDRGTAALLRSAGVADIIIAGLDQNSVPLAPVQHYSSRSPGLRAVYVDPVISAALATREDTSEQVALIRQRFLAETAVVAQRPAEAERTIVVGPVDMRWDPQPRILNALLRATRQAPWIQPTLLNDASTTTAVPAPATQAGSGSPGGSELSRDYLERIRVMQGKLNRFVSILSDPGPSWQEDGQALLRAQSTAWRSQPWTGIELLQFVSQDLDSARGKVTVLSEGSITFSGDKGRIPITVANDLDQTVHVGLRLVGEPRLRLVAQDVTSLTIDPHRKVSVDMDVQVVGSDALPVTVQVLTPDGRVLQSTQVITVLTTAYARAAGWVVIGAFGAIAVFVIIGIARRIAAARRRGATSGTTSAESSSHD